MSIRTHRPLKGRTPDTNDTRRTCVECDTPLSKYNTHADRCWNHRPKTRPRTRGGNNVADAATDRQQLIDKAIYYVCLISDRRDAGPAAIAELTGTPVNDLTVSALEELVDGLAARTRNTPTREDASMPDTRTRDETIGLPPAADIWEELADMVGFAGESQCDACAGRGSIYRRATRAEVKALLADRRTAQGVNLARISEKLANPTLAQLEAIRQTAGLKNIDQTIRLIGRLAERVDDELAQGAA